MVILAEPVWKTRFVRLQRLAWLDAEHHRLVFTFRAMAFSTKQIRNMVELC